LKKAFGNFLIGKHRKDGKLYLLELGGRNDNEIITKMMLGHKRLVNLSVDAWASNPYSSILFETQSRELFWFKTEKFSHLDFIRGKRLA
jgi:hypothetical protein